MNEARIKLSVDASQAQREVNNLGRQISELGSGGPHIDVQQAMGTGSSGVDSASDSQNSQRRLANSLEDYLSGVEKSNEKIIEALGSIEQYLRGNPNNAGSQTSNSPNSNQGKQNDSLMGKLSKTLFSMQAISSAISATLSYVKSGMESAQTSEMAAYKAYGTLGIYKDYGQARNETAEVGLSLGYDAANSIAVANAITSGTGSAQKFMVLDDLEAILKGARGLNVDEFNLANSASGFYQSGTYTNGEMNQFVNLLGTLVNESGMTGREDETLDVLNNIHASLKENLTTITQSQHESVLGLYSLMTEYNSNFKGANGSNMLTSLNSYMTGNDPALNIALGWGTEYQGWSGWWELAQQKEKGLGDPENLKSILETFNAYSSYDVGSEGYMGQLYQYMNTNFGANTEFTRFMAENMDQILSGDYSSDFKESLQSYNGVDSNVEGYLDTSLATKNEYDAQTANAAEKISSDVEESLGWLERIYNKLPAGAQAGVTVGKNVVGTLGQGALAYFGWKGASAVGAKMFGAGAASAAGTAGAASAAGTAGATAASTTAGTAAAGGKAAILTLPGAGMAAATVIVAPLLTSGGSYKHLTAAGRKSDSNDWMDKYAAEMGTEGTSLDDKWEEIKNTSGVFYGDYTKEDLENRYTAREEMMNFYQSEQGMQYFHDQVEAELEANGKLTEDFLKGLLSWTSDNGTTYTGSQDDIEQIMQSMFGSEYDYSRPGQYSYRFANKSISKWFKNNNDDFDLSEASTNGLKYNGDQLISSDDAQSLTESIDELNLTVEDMREWLEQHGYTGTAALSDDGVVNTYNGAILGTNGTASPLFNPWGFSFSGSHATGHDYIPYDGYVAELHKGEAVLDKNKADEYRSRTSNGGSHASVLEIKLSGSVDGMTQDNQNQITKAVVAQIQQYMNNASIMNQLANGTIRVAN